MTIPWKVVRVQIAGCTGLGRGLAPRAALAVLSKPCSPQPAPLEQQTRRGRPRCHGGLEQTDNCPGLTCVLKQSCWVPGKVPQLFSLRKRPFGSTQADL